MTCTRLNSDGLESFGSAIFPKNWGTTTCFASVLCFIAALDRASCWPLLHALLSLLYLGCFLQWLSMTQMQFLEEFPDVLKKTGGTGISWLVPPLCLMEHSTTAVWTPDHLTLHFPHGSRFPAASLCCQVMKTKERWKFFSKKLWTSVKLGAMLCISGAGILWTMTSWCLSALDTVVSQIIEIDLMARCINILNCHIHIWLFGTGIVFTVRVYMNMIIYCEI